LDDERELLQRSSTLDPSAFAAIYDALYGPLYRYIYNQVGHVETAEDLVDEVFVRLVDRTGEGRGPQKHLRAWLYRVAHNLVVDEARRSAHRSHLPLDERLPDGEPDPSAQAERRIARQQAQQALALLTDQQRAAVSLRYLEGLANEEVAQVLGITAGGVKRLLRRGLAALRTHLVHLGTLSEEVT
jgi:RNA polymerase sigma-70 factor, ECF subfamily